MASGVGDMKLLEECKKSSMARKTELGSSPRSSEAELVNAEHFVQEHEHSNDTLPNLATKVGQV